MRKRRVDGENPVGQSALTNPLAHMIAPMEIDFQGATIRSVMIEGVPWFVAKDVCDALELVDTTTALRNLDDDERTKAKVWTGGGVQDVNVIDESGLSSLAFISTKTEAKKFRKWVTRVVLPSLRRGATVDAPQTIPPVGHVSLQDLEQGTYVRHFLSPEVDALALAAALVGALWRKYRLLDGLSAFNEHSNTSYQLGQAIQQAEHIAKSAMRSKQELTYPPEKSGT